MDWLARIWREIDPIWWGFLIAFLISPVLAWAPLRRLERAWLTYRLQRRLARDPYILQSELNELERQLGDPPPPIDWRATMLFSLTLIGIIALFTAINVIAEPDSAGLIFMVAVLVGNFLWQAWKWYRQPVETRSRWPWSAPDVTIPREAAYGFLAAVVFVGILLVGFWQLV